MKYVLDHARHLFLGAAIAGCLVVAAPAGVAQATQVTYVLEDVWLEADITHPGSPPRQMTGTFTWTYVPGDFENGSGQFTALYIPWYGTDFPSLAINIELSSIECSMPGSTHSGGLDITLRLLQPLSLDQPSAVDPVTSLFDIWSGPNYRGHVISGDVVPASSFGTFCFGDGSGTPCPCSNPGEVGEGCANSSDAGGLLAAGGSSSVGADDLGFVTANLLPGQPALLFCGQNAVNGGVGSSFGDGLRCAGGGITRLGVAIPGAGGDANWGPGLSVSGGWIAGDTRHFQGWYRDPSGSPCANGFNLTQGVTVVFTP
jgi:hypothetical protein